MAKNPRDNKKTSAAEKSTSNKAPAALAAGLKDALGIAANEVLVESLEAIADDPEAFLEGGDLGATYQSPIGPQTFPPAEVDRLLADLAAWDPGAEAPAWERLDTAMFAAGMDFARALVHLATGAGELPPTVGPHQDAIGHVVRALETAIAEGHFDDEDLDELLR